MVHHIHQITDFAFDEYPSPSIFYEDGAILSLMPFSNKARLKSIWAEQDLYNVFDLDYIVRELILLEQNLKRDIQDYFQIELEKFIKHIPLQRG